MLNKVDLSLKLAAITFMEKHTPKIKYSSKIEIKRREYNQFVATESIEDYALRYSPASFRKWSEFLVANTALGSISFLALEAIGASIAINYGFANAFWGILTAAIIIFLMGLPICYQAAKHNIDIDLLTRATGFGYIGSTITSLIYASFCFIFFALEAAIMAQALLLYFDIPLSIGYAISSIIIIPIVFYGMSIINRLQLYTLPIWLILMFLPFIMVLTKEPLIVDNVLNFAGTKTHSSEFSFYYYGFAIGISLSLIAQIGEQVDYLRFMPDKTPENRFKWWCAVIFAGPGWIILGFLKQIGGILLAALVLLGGASVVKAREPIYMYNAAYDYVFANPSIAITVSFIFVILSQIKINVTNAYAGSLAWSNFFSRLTHSHPGRVVWLLFNIIIALLLMELGVFQVLENILGLYSNIAIAWIAAIVADIVVIKPLGLSPKMIEFKRAHLFNINPVGVFSTLFASLLSIIAFSGLLGFKLQAFSSIIALCTSFVLAILIAIITQGKYYIARQEHDFSNDENHLCSVCHIHYHAKDMAFCPMYQNNICSLCCSLEGRCHDQCKDKKEFSLRDKIVSSVMAFTKYKFQHDTVQRLTSFFLVFLGLLIVMGFMLWTSYSIQTAISDVTKLAVVQNVYYKIFYLFSAILMLSAWLIVLINESRELVENELVVKNEALELSETNLDRAQKVAGLGSWELDLVNNKLTWSDEVFRIFEMPQDKFTATYEGFVATIHPDDRAMVKSAYESSLANKTPYNIEHRLLMPNKKIKYVTERGETQFDEQGKPLKSFGTVLDITELKIAQEVIHHQAHYDSLTNLPNRFLVLDRLAQLMNEAQRNNTMISVLFIDLDDFKKINDSLGHNAGDKVLIEAAKRLVNVVRSEDTVSRLGGDEFLILLGHHTSPADAEIVAENLINELRKIFYIDERELIITASIGIAIYPNDGDNVTTLLKHSDSAMYHAKAMGRNTYAYFTHEMNNAVMRRLAIEEQIHHALSRNEFSVYYQPKIEISSGKIIGAEALLRWHNHKLGEISPTEFIVIAEQTGTIIPIGEFVLTVALKQTKQWQLDYQHDFQIAVNLSPRQFRDLNLTTNIAQALTNSDVAGNTLELEITEGVLMSGYLYVEQALQELSALGISIAMDDFGTGYSSLSYLRNYPFDILKIDRNFIKDMTDNKADRDLVKATIAMARSLNLKVVAEGVENKKQLSLLKQYHCDLAQGYFFSKPITAKEMGDLLKNKVNFMCSDNE